MDAGEQVLLGVVPNGATELDEARTTERVLRLLDLLGLEPGENLVLTPACGLAGMHAERAGRTLAHLTRCARNLSLPSHTPVWSPFRHHDFTVRVPSHHVQLGRAACRERGCPYF